MVSPWPLSSDDAKQTGRGDELLVSLHQGGEEGGGALHCQLHLAVGGVAGQQRPDIVQRHLLTVWGKLQKHP